jgi:hypothetical protein
VELEEAREIAEAVDSVSKTEFDLLKERISFVWWLMQTIAIEPKVCQVLAYLN